MTQIKILRWKIDQPLLIKSIDRMLEPSELENNHITLPQGVNELEVRFRVGGEHLKPVRTKTA